MTDTTSTDLIVISVGPEVCIPTCVSGELSWTPSENTQQILNAVPAEARDEVIKTLNGFVHGFGKVLGSLANLAQYGEAFFSTGVDIVGEDLFASATALAEAHDIADRKAADGDVASVLTMIFGGPEDMDDPDGIKLLAGLMAAAKPAPTHDEFGLRGPSVE